MRDFVIIVLILGSVPVCFVSPYFGVLMWSWIAYFNPHRYGWGMAYDFPAAIVVAVPTLVGTLFTRQLNRRFFVRETLLLMGLWLWFVVTTAHAIHVPEFMEHIEDCQSHLVLVSKVLLMTFLTIVLVASPKKLKYLLLVIAFSFGVRAVAGALFGVRTGGEFRVYGPPDSFIADNNAFGLALNMSLPMLFFLAREEQSRPLRLALWVGFYCGIVSVLLTYSRGALLGLVATLCLLSFKAKRTVLALTLLVSSLFVVVSFAPSAWMSRMQEFTGGKVDSSAEMRLISWGFAWNLVRAYPLSGGGFDVFTDVPIYQRYEPEPLPGGADSSEAHSIYFQMLGEQGFVGLGLFLLLLCSSVMSLRGLRRQARRSSDAMWVIPYSHMLETSLVGYMVSGAFLSLAYFDLFYVVVACVAVIKVLYRQQKAMVLGEPIRGEGILEVGEPAPA